MEQIPKYDDFYLFRQLGNHTQTGLSPEAALSAIYQRYKGVLARYIKNYIRHDEALVKDVISETMRILWMQRAEIAAKENPRSWLMTIAHHVAVTQVRARKKYYTEPLENHLSLSGSDHAAREVERKELDRLFREAVKKLPPQERNVLLLSKVENLPHKKIASRFKVSAQTVKNQLSRALKKVHRYVSDMLSGIFI